MIHAAHFSKWLWVSEASECNLGEAKPGNAEANWTGMASYQADYCHSSSGNGDSTGGSAPFDVQLVIESAAAGGR